MQNVFINTIKNDNLDKSSDNSLKDSKNLNKNSYDLNSSTISKPDVKPGNRASFISPEKTLGKTEFDKSQEKKKINYDDGKYVLVFNEKYHPKVPSITEPINQEKLPDGKIINFFINDKREIIFPSGVRKEIFSDGYSIVYFVNKDIKQVKIFLFFLIFLDLSKWKTSIFFCRC